MFEVQLSLIKIFTKLTVAQLVQTGICYDSLDVINVQNNRAYLNMQFTWGYKISKAHEFSWQERQEKSGSKTATT